MGHVWTWLESKEEFFTESERSSGSRSPEGSSSLDFELSSWRESEEMTEVELEESSNWEEDNQLETMATLQHGKKAAKRGLKRAKKGQTSPEVLVRDTGAGRCA
ncbi:hypothetical protein JRQ81_002776 [Phrynocephalus forsythii]|uniref:Uncharacterized protein n=1 Tax=Phrynocephalus forsythii TaxID=171643 RepID=A0A9Q0XIL6_9SAUR|nr:hypothetical protein JRQ81_002776 [Phrynocephalus forsythii]